MQLMAGIHGFRLGLMTDVDSSFNHILKTVAYKDLVLKRETRCHGGAAEETGPSQRRRRRRRTLDSVLVDLVSDSDEDVLEVATAAAASPTLNPPLEPGGAPRVLVRRRRRLLLDPGEAPAVPVYSEKVKSSLHLIPDNVSLLKLCPPEAEEEADVEDASSPHTVDFPRPSSPWKKKLRSKDGAEKKQMLLAQDTSPLPSPLPRTKSRKHTQALRKLREVNKRLQDLRSCLSPKQSQGQAHLSQEDEVVLVEGPTLPEHPRLLPLKIRCRADLVRLPIRMSEPLKSVVDHMAAHLGVSPSRILLLLGETELSPTATPRTLKLGVADIIDCVVLASSPEAAETSPLLQLRVQGKEKHQTLEVSLPPDSPLKTLMSRYEEAMGLSGHKLSFFFDGTKLSGKELLPVWRPSLDLRRMGCPFGP
ncbi:NFATC2-interacting protein-like [Ovis aries]|uniref:NFATC2-interacting protein-like n=1 Tax=Ovis aries TaxID=9940 RepID=UPI001C2E479B|nr:NFATC2-interacting protein-like [Ovis aries]